MMASARSGLALATLQLAGVLVAAQPFPSNPPFIFPGTPDGVPGTYDCAVRKSAWEFGKTTLPQRGEFKSLYDALQLHACNVSLPLATDSWTIPVLPTPDVGPVFFVDPSTGEDLAHNRGSRTTPFRTINAAVSAASNHPGASVLLRSGVHYLQDQVVITEAHKGLTIQSYAGEHAVVSGGVPLKGTWVPYKVDKAAGLPSNIWRMDLKGSSIKEMFGLRVDGVRATRAKYPNGNPEESGPDAATLMQYKTGWVTAKTDWVKPADKWTETQDVVAGAADWPNVTWPSTQEGGSSWTGEGDWGDYHLGMGGFCDDLTPPFGYWCSQKPPRGQCYNSKDRTSRGCTQTHMSPDGVYYKGLLPRADNYSDPRGAVVQVWRGQARWYTNLCKVSGIDKEQGVLTFEKGVHGCNQGGEGEVTGSQWWIENVFEELDTPGEWFFNESTQQLYYFFNGTEPPSKEQFVATQKKVLFNVTGTQAKPVQDFALRGVEIRDTALTYLGTDVADLHGMPSGGDWALQRSGAILLEGTERAVIDSCLLTRIDGNGIFLSNYNRNATISGNELSWVGDSAIAAWGSTGHCLTEKCDRTVPWKVGPDGRGGDQPIGTHIVGNLVREIGIWQKQSSMWFQAVTGKTHLERNVHFNGPRAGLNFNDGFMGGDIIEGNLLVNCVRESGDHGPWNSWDRVPYITTEGMIRDKTQPAVGDGIPGHQLANGKPSVVPRFREIRHNFIIGNYQGQEAIDTDDGSSYYQTHDNYFPMGGAGLKSDFGGQWNHHFRNVYGYVGSCFNSANNLAFYDNICVSRSHGYASTCKIPSTMTVRGNKVYTSDGKVKICDGDNGTTVAMYPSDNELNEMGAAALAPFPRPAPAAGIRWSMQPAAVYI